MAYNQVDDVTQELGVASISQTLLENVTQYHAQIGANVKRDHLQELEWRLLATAKDLFHHKKYEEALNTFTHCLAVTEKTRTSKDHAVRGAVIHNIASCLHNLGEMEAAQARFLMSPPYPATAHPSHSLLTRRLASYHPPTNEGASFSWLPARSLPPDGHATLPSLSVHYLKKGPTPFPPGVLRAGDRGLPEG